MDFAKKQLEKYGWQEGKGLGRREDGISTPIKPTLKFDTAGIGHDASDEFTNNWWDKLYSAASGNVNIINNDKGDVQMNLKSAESIDIKTKGYSFKSAKNLGLEYGSFLKTAKLTGKGIEELDGGSRKAFLPDDIPKINILNDDELLAACGGRTAHKGARHGLKLSGKLSRLEKQEKLLLKRLRTVSLSDESDVKQNKLSMQKKLKKLYDHREKDQLEVMDENSCQSLSSSPSSSTSGKKRRKLKRVSFSDTVTEYQRQDNVDSDVGSRPTTPVSTIIKQVKIKEDENTVEELAQEFNSGDQDEGIDCSDDIKARIKEENRVMKRKLKMLRKKNRSDPIVNETSPPDCSNSKCLKRKSGSSTSLNIDCKRCHYEDWLDNNIEQDKPKESLSKKQIKKLRKAKRMEKRINKVADSLNECCKIGNNV